MTIWQKILLYAILAFSALHAVRDILQDKGSKSFLATLWNKPQPASNVYSYIIESILITLVIVSVARGSFGYAGYGAFILLGASFMVWLAYYFV